MPLTAKQVAAAQPKDKPYKLADAQRLYLYVATSGTKSWRYDYKDAGKNKTKTLGQYPAVSLADARMAHAQFRDALAEPAEKVAPSFEAVAAAWLKVKLPTLSNPKHQIQVAETLVRHVYPAIGKKPIDRIKRQELVDVVREVVESGLVETAHRVASRINMVFDHAQDSGILDAHPASGLARAIGPRRRKRPMASLPPEEAGALLLAIQGHEEEVTRLGLMLAAYTFVRTGELRGAQWNEFILSDGVWVIPEERMKLRKPHVVPLSRQVLAILERLQILAADSPYVLNSPIRHGKPISENTMLFALYKLGYRRKMTVHGFRALASSVLNEQSGFAHEAIERQLSHQEKDTVRAAYNRAEYLPVRRVMMQWWADWIDSQYKSPDPHDASASPPPP